MNTTYRVSHKTRPTYFFPAPFQFFVYLFWKIELALNSIPLPLKKGTAWEEPKVTKWPLMFSASAKTNSIVILSGECWFGKVPLWWVVCKPILVFSLPKLNNFFMMFWLMDDIWRAFNRTSDLSELCLVIGHARTVYMEQEQCQQAY